MLIDLTNKNITGKHAEIALGKAGITVNKNMVPFDSRSPFVTSGIRIGTPAVTTRGMKGNEMQKIGAFINKALVNHENETVLSSIKSEVREFCSVFPLFNVSK
jgi:glycine hydroxymethyltransferase